MALKSIVKNRLRKDFVGSFADTVRFVVILVESWMLMSMAGKLGRF